MPKPPLPEPKVNPTVPVPQNVDRTKCEIALCTGTGSHDHDFGVVQADGSITIVQVRICEPHHKKGAFNLDEIPARAQSTLSLPPQFRPVPPTPTPSSEGDPMVPRKTADSENYQVIDDSNLLDGVEARTRQLEAERAAYSGLLEESTALGEEDEIKAHQETLDKVNKRLEVVYKRRDALLRNIAVAAREEEAKQAKEKTQE